MAEFKIAKTVELSSMPNPQLARDLLERLRAATAKVMTNRKWKVGVLKEFYPKNKGLLGLNVNRGQSIMIRLREGVDQFSFLPWHSLLGTLVHELTHNEIGEHSAEFYKAVDKLYDEVEATGSDAGSLWNARNAPGPKYDFDGKSAKVGGGQLAKAAGIPGTSVRQLAAEAALRRASQAKSGPQVLGGARPAPQKTHKELFMEGEMKRRQQYEAGQGCSVVKSPVTATKGDATQILDTAPIDPVRRSLHTDDTVWQWTCHVCTELNTSLLPAVLTSAAGSSSSSSSRVGGFVKAEGGAGAPYAGGDVVCAWCGCAYGSTLEQPTLTLTAATTVTTDTAGSSSSSSAASAPVSYSGIGGLEVICIDCAPETSAAGADSGAGAGAGAGAGPSKKRRRRITEELHVEQGGQAFDDTITAVINLTSDEQDAQNIYAQQYCARSLLQLQDCACCVPQHQAGHAVKPEPRSTQAGRSREKVGDSKLGKENNPIEIIDLFD